MAEINGAALCVKDMRNLPLLGLNVWGRRQKIHGNLRSGSGSVQIGVTTAVLVEDEISPNVRKLLREEGMDEFAQERES